MSPDDKLRVRSCIIGTCFMLVGIMIFYIWIPTSQGLEVYHRLYAAAVAGSLIGGVISYFLLKLLDKYFT